MKAHERYITPCPLPTEHEREVLTILGEECNEVGQRVAKLLRFGRDEVQPGQPFNNSQRLGFEIGDIFAMVAMARDLGLVDQASIDHGIWRKPQQLAKFMQTSPLGIEPPAAAVAPQPVTSAAPRTFWQRFLKFIGRCENCRDWNMSMFGHLCFNRECPSHGPDGKSW